MKKLSTLLIFVLASAVSAFAGYGNVVAANSTLQQQINPAANDSDFWIIPVNALGYGIYMHDATYNEFTWPQASSRFVFSVNRTTYAATLDLDLADKADVSSLAPVATSGSYSDLTGKPSLSGVATSGAYSDLSGRPSLASVATSGAYSDLTGKPTLSTVSATGAYSDLTGKPSLATVATSGAYSDLTGKPSVATSSTDGLMSASDKAKMGAMPGSLQRLRAQTDSSGNYTWTFGTAFAGGVTPVITAIAETSSSNSYNVQIVSVSNTAVTVKVYSMGSVNLLSTLLALAPAGAQAYVHFTAIAP